MLKGLHLTLMVGPRVPAPVPQNFIYALSDAEIKTDTKGPSAFQLKFEVEPHAQLQSLFTFAGGGMAKEIRIVLVATLRGRPHVLVDGVMTNQQTTPGLRPGTTTLTVTGEDLTRVMDYEERHGESFPGQPIEVRVLRILARYASYGIVPAVVPELFKDVESPLERVAHQKGTDLQYLRALAEYAGYVFYIDPGPAPGVSKAYWGPEVRAGAPQPPLNVDMGGLTNTDSLNFTFDSEQAEQPVVDVQIPFTKLTISVPVPSVDLLNPSLGSITPVAKRKTKLQNTSKLNFTKAMLRGLATAASSLNAARGEGTLDVLRYGSVLKPRNLVLVRGAGKVHDGIWYVESVTHQIQRGQFKQHFSLSRNALGSSVQTVPA